jgi:prolyl-tRNA synthetase
LRDATEQLYQALLATGIDVLLDDRKVRAGFMFSDMELIGIPHRLVISDKGLDAETIEYRARTESESVDLPLAGIVEFIQAKLA